MGINASGHGASEDCLYSLIAIINGSQHIILENDDYLECRVKAAKEIKIHRLNNRPISTLTPGWEWHVQPGLNLEIRCTSDRWQPDLEIGAAIAHIAADDYRM